MLAAVLVIFLAAAIAPTLHRLLPAFSHWLLALVPAGVTVWFAQFLGPVSGGETVLQVVPWVPALGVELAFRLDGLSLLFALLVTGIGTFITAYAGGYLHGHEHQGRFYLFLLAFMGSMLGLVLADDVISLFVFWELTSVTSFLLIGFNHEDGRSRRSAVQALVVTSLGGLALLAGLVLMGLVGEGWRLTAMEASGIDFRAHALYLPILVLILLGAFTKSAQVPFHFWLPNAMDAPTPVSAYLHSATMVKAGVYLVARLNPTLGGTEVWTYTLAAFGTVTAVWGGLMALRSTDLKKVLAYTTLMALGTLTMLVGLGTEYALKGFAVFLLAHSLYKGALFMGAGAVDHGTGTRDVNQLSGLWPKMRLTGLFILLASLSMAGLPPFFGFLGKELMYEGMLEAGSTGTFVLVGMVLANATMLGAAGLVFVKPFLGKPSQAAEHAHEGSPSLWIGPAVLASLGLAFGLFGSLPAPLMGAVTSAVAGTAKTVDLHLWHGLTPALGLSAVTVALGAALFLGLRGVTAALGGLARASRVNFDAAWDHVLAGVDALARAVTNLLQAGRLSRYMLLTIAVMFALPGITLLLRGGFAMPKAEGWAEPLGWFLCFLMLLGTFGAMLATSRLAAVTALSISGLAVALFFLAYSAPDVGITQLMVETLTVIIIVLVLAKLPKFGPSERTDAATRLVKLVVAVAAGGVTTAILLSVTAQPLSPHLSDYFAAASYVEAYGRNVVNVIIVDFRGFDTLGEITVVAMAGLGVLALLKARNAPKPEEDAAAPRLDPGKPMTGEAD
ncbi:putative monovalent cation/H+ antiporter subunit A [Aerophototrophica crusticola]|uniref:Monovalent cation/H+ antiporter subunit A n=1 Tax=Aerophototrophica crusticola TaxID=1709002 RepID=A0A858R7G2_9PROT|nr:putative monovalent cation/H+ antiporter subunit A [Rhodospirillaceae bacterium B3]